MTDLIDRAALVAFMERVLRNLTADELASDAFLRGYRQAMTDVRMAATVRPEAGDAAVYRARQMNAELPQAARDVLALKGMI